MDKLLIKERLRKFNFVMTRPIVMAIIFILLLGVGIIRQQDVINNAREAAENSESAAEDAKEAAQDAKTSADNSVQLLIRMKESLCLLVVHAEESPNVIITSDIREFCGDIFRVNPLPPAESQPVASEPSQPTEMETKPKEQTPPPADDDRILDNPICAPVLIFPLINLCLEV